MRGSTIEISPDRHTFTIPGFTCTYTIAVSLLLLVEVDGLIPETGRLDYTFIHSNRELRLITHLEIHVESTHTSLL